MPITGATVSGDLVEEDDQIIALQAGEQTQVIPKTNVKVQATLIDFDENVIVGELVSENEDEITLMVDGEEQIIDTFDIDEGPTYSRAFGKRLVVTSPMPNNFPLLLSVSDMSDLLAYLASLTGATDATPVEGTQETANKES